MKLVVYAPKTHVDPILEALHQTGCGKSDGGKYEGRAFLTFGHGTWIALKGSKPFKGRLNRREMVQEVRIETTCPKEKSADILRIIRSIHPYEEPVIEIYSLDAVSNAAPLKAGAKVLRYK